MNRLGYFIVGAVAGAAGLLVAAYFENRDMSPGAKEDGESDNLSEAGSDTASQRDEATVGLGNFIKYFDEHFQKV